MIYVFLAQGFEEIEALTAVDILRRAGYQVVTAAVGTENGFVTGAHQITVKADILEEAVKTDDCEAVVLPGGMPGAANLEKSAVVLAAVESCLNRKKIVAAICAAPFILGHLGALKGKNATCYDGFEKELEGAHVTKEQVCQDDTIITGRGPGAAMAFALKIVEAISGEDLVNKLRMSMLCQPM